MIKLFIDTATAAGSIALYNDTELLSFLIFQEKLKHLQILHPAIDYILKLNHISIKDIELIGVDIGPGSFTGIRIGVTAARALAQLNKSYIYGVTSLDLIKEKLLFFNGIICPIIDAKKNRVFTALYNKSERISDYFDITIEELISFIKSKNITNIIFGGDGLKLYKSILIKELPTAIFTGKQFYYPEARDSNYIINYENLTKNYNQIKPFYIRKSDAEINKKN